MLSIADLSRLRSPSPIDNSEPPTANMPRHKPNLVEAMYRDLFEAAERELISLRTRGGSEGFWTREKDKAGIREKVARAKGEEVDGLREFGPLVWVSSVSTSSH
jgi:hypothetical protein